MINGIKHLDNLVGSMLTADVYAQDEQVARFKSRFGGE